jgi:hypothetical protein
MIIKELVKIKELNFVKSNCNSLLFDGVNEDLLVTPASNFNFEWTDSWSIDGWIFPRSSTVGIHIALSKWDISLPRGWFLAISGFTAGLSGSLRFQIRTGASGYLDAYSNTGVVFDQWNHIAVTYDGSGTNAGVTFYINGVATSKPNFITALGPGPITSGTIINPEPVTINSIPDLGNYAVDYLQAMRVWDVVLTPAEINELTNKTSVPQGTNLILDLDIGRSKFNGSEWEVPDQTGKNTVISRNMESDDLTSNCPGIIPQYSLSFDGVNEYINCTDNNAFTFGNATSDFPFSMSVWVKMVDATDFRMISKYISSGGREYFFGTTTDDTVIFVLYNHFSDFRFVYIKSTVPLSENVWTNVTVTYDGQGGSTAYNGQKIYVDGQLQSTTFVVNGVYSAMTNKTAPVEIGALSSIGSYANGKIAGARMWNVELTASEVLAYYNETNSFTSVQPSALVLDVGFKATVFNGTEFDIPDPTGITTGYTSVNMEAEDKTNDYPS